MQAHKEHIPSMISSDHVLPHLVQGIASLARLGAQSRRNRGFSPRQGAGGGIVGLKHSIGTSRGQDQIIEFSNSFSRSETFQQRLRTSYSAVSNSVEFAGGMIESVQTNEAGKFHYCLAALINCLFEMPASRTLSLSPKSTRRCAKTCIN